MLQPAQKRPRIKLKKWCDDLHSAGGWGRKMGDEIVGELGKAARGGVLALVGLAVSALFGFLTRALIGRAFGPKVYGAYNLALTVFTVVLVVAMLGFPSGLQRQVAYFLHREREKTGELVSTAVILVLLTSSLGLVVIEVVKGYLPAYIGGGNLLVSLLETLALALPFVALFNILIATSQGFGRVREFVIYSKIAFPFLYFMIVLVFVLLSDNITSVPLAYLITAAFMLALLSRDLIKAGILTSRLELSPGLAKTLLLFSLPLMTSNLIFFILNWTDTLMLGHYLGEEIVGLYNAASPLARFIPVFLASLTVLYNPIATGFFARGESENLKRFYVIITKWVVLLTFPLFVLLVAYPIPVLRLLFGGEYVDAWKPLIILSVGFMFHSVLGPNGLTLLTMGRPTENLKGDLLGAGLNVLLNYLLIPVYGMTGAAIATASSYLVTNLYKSLRLATLGISPLNGRYMRILLIGGLTTGIAMLLRTEGITVALLLVTLESIGFYVASLVLGAFEEEDVSLLRLAGEKFGVDFGRIEKLLLRFAR